MGWPRTVRAKLLELSVLQTTHYSTNTIVHHWPRTKNQQLKRRKGRGVQSWEMRDWQ